MTLDKIDDCPFCGAIAELKYKPFYDFETIAIIGCLGCKVQLQRFTAEEAIAAWNRREKNAAVSEGRNH